MEEEQARGPGPVHQHSVIDVEHDPAELFACCRIYSRERWVICLELLT